MRFLRNMALAMAAAALLTTGFYGCAKKQVKDTGGAMEAPKPESGQEAKEAPKTEGEKDAKRETNEAPPGPRETPEPTESLRPEKALNDIFYDFDRFEIRGGDASVLQQNAKWLKDNEGHSVTIEGHCDERGTVEYNLALGEKRADAAKDYLASLGIDASRMKTLSYGKSKPLDAGHDETAWAKNRRAHFVVQ